MSGRQSGCSRDTSLASGVGTQNNPLCVKLSFGATAQEVHFPRRLLGDLQAQLSSVEEQKTLQQGWASQNEGNSCPRRDLSLDTDL